LEAREATGTISVRKLQALAATMGCTFVYGFVPTGSFEAMAQTTQGRQDAARVAHRKLPRAL
jgi:hypothetical protein